MTDSRVGAGEWINPPPHYEDRGDTLLVTTGLQTDFWRHTSYGFVHDSGHALVQDLPDARAIELSVSADFDHDFDQAGVMVWADEAHWIKCGVEYADGVIGLGAVVTDGSSDWSTAPVPEWQGHRVFVRVSRQGDALTVRAGISPTQWRLVRLAPIDPSLPWRAGPYAASPSREGLVVAFSDYHAGPADSSLHESALDNEERSTAVEPGDLSDQSAAR